MKYLNWTLVFLGFLILIGAAGPGLIFAFEDPNNPVEDPADFLLTDPSAEGKEFSGTLLVQYYPVTFDCGMLGDVGGPMNISLALYDNGILVGNFSAVANKPGGYCFTEDAANGKQQEALENFLDEVVASGLTGKNKKYRDLIIKNAENGYETVTTNFDAPVFGADLIIVGQK